MRRIKKELGRMVDIVYVDMRMNELDCKRTDEGMSGKEREEYDFLEERRESMSYSGGVYRIGREICRDLSDLGSRVGLFHR